MTVVSTENKEVLLLGVICELAVLPALTAVLVVVKDIEDTTIDGRLRAVTLALVFAAVESSCPLVPSLMREIAPEPLAVSDELSGRPFSMLWEAGWVLWAELRTLGMTGAIFGIIVGGIEFSSVQGTVGARSEVSERGVLGVLDVPNNFPSSLAVGSAGNVAPRLLEAGWGLPGGGARFVASGMSFEASGGWFVDF